MGKALKTAGAIIGGAVLMATGVGALAGVQVTAMGIAGIGTMSVANLQLMSAGLMAAGSMLDKPKSTASGSPSDWTSNPDQGIPFLFGRMGVAGKIVHRDEYGQDNRLQGIVTIYSGAGPVKSFQGFTADELPVSFVSNGGTAVGKYNRQMWRSWRLGEQPDTALSLPTGLDGGAVMPMWGPLYKLSGKACDLLTLQQDSKFSVYPSGEPKPMQVLEGVYGYDPRYDDSYPGGAGPCRYGVRSTYRYIDNAIIAALNWALGMVENGQVVGGIGASLQGVDLPAFVEAANIADANAWTVAAWPDTSEDASVVLDELLEAGGAKRSRVAGKISCVSRGAPRPSIVTITRRDTAGAIELDTGASRFNRLNTITPVIMSEAHKWQHAPMNPVSFAPLVAEDGGKRSDKIKYRFVPKVKQGAELAAYDILDAREPFAGTIPLLPHLRRLKPGDCFDIDEPGFMLDGVKMLVLGRAYDPKAGEVRIAFRSETDSKHPLALGKTTTMPAYPGLTAPDPTEVSPPQPGDWTIIPRPPAPGGGQLPVIDLSGIVSNATADAMLINWREVVGGEDPTAQPPFMDEEGELLPGWVDAGVWPPTTRTLSIQGPQPGAQIWIAVRYKRGNNVSPAELAGPITVSDLIAGDTTHLNGEPVQDVLDRLTDTKTLADQNRQAVEALEGAYGPTVNAATSAAAAAASEAAATQAKADAIIAKGEAQDARDEAAQKALDAAGSAAASAGSATAADNARAAAVIAKGQAQGAASDAAADALVAAQKAGEALGSANSAAGSATTATTKAGEAGTAAAAALASSVTATTAKDGARNAASAVYPADFSQDGRFFTFGPQGNPATATEFSAAAAPTRNIVFKNVDGVGRVLQESGSALRHLRSRNLRPAIPGARYRIRARVRWTTLPSSGTASLSLQRYGLQADFTTIKYGPANDGGSLPGSVSTVSSGAKPVGTWTDLGFDHVIAANPDYAWFAPTLYASHSSGDLGVYEVQFLSNDDVTAQVASEKAAAASATSASNAAASETAAGQSASAADTSRQQAQTARAGAEAAQSSAADSATTATGAAATATQQAGLATSAKNASETAAQASVNARDQAASFADDAEVSANASSAASVTAVAARQAAETAQGASEDARDQSQSAATASAGSASSAAASETAAGQSASAANTAKTAAETARGQAQAAATQAADSRDTAEGHAASASASAALAADSEDAAAGAAIAAAGSASTADTKAGEAGVSAAAAQAASVSATAAKEAAEASATASASSASSAAASETASGQSASAALAAKIDAETARSQAQTSASNAADAATNAAGSAATASSAASQSVTAKDQAQGFATAANTSAQNAAGSATAAGNSASAANTSKTAAEAAYGGVVASAIAGLGDTISSETHTANNVGAPSTVPNWGGSGMSSDSSTSLTTIYWKGVARWEQGRVYELTVNIRANASDGPAPHFRIRAGLLSEDYVSEVRAALSPILQTPIGQANTITFRVGCGLPNVPGVTNLSGTDGAPIRFGAQFNRTSTAAAYQPGARSSVRVMTLRDVTAVVAAEKVRDNTIILGGNQGFEEGLTGWASRANTAGWMADASTPTYLASFEGRAHVAKWVSGAYGQAFMAKRFPIDTSRKYIIRGRAWASGAGASIRIAIQARNDAGAEIPGAFQYRQHLFTSPGAGWMEVATPVISGEGASLSNFTVGTKAIQIGILSNVGGVAVETALDGIWLEDVTESESAKAQATASATSAASAAASATLAGEKATAAQTSATAADTSRGQAQTAASQASQSETNAAGSAASASTAAQNAATSRDQASGFATAASGSASTASTKANEAGNSAAAAAASQVSASAAKDAAVSAKDGAETARGQAQSSATAAATSASNASASATTAGEKATSASGSAVTAATKAGEASTFASQAASSAADAAGSAVTASTASGTAVTARDAAIGARNDAQAAAATAVAQSSSASASAASASISANLAAKVGQQNEYANADLSQGTYGFTPIWGFGGPLPSVSVTTGGEAIRFLKTGGEFDGSSTRYGIIAMDGGGVSKSAGGAPARKMWPVASGEKIGFAMDGRTRAGSARWYIDVRWCAKDGTGSTSLGSAQTAHGETAWQRIGVINTAPGDGFVWAEATVILGWDGSSGVADMELRRPTLARLIATATDLPVFSAPAGGGALSDLSASLNITAAVAADAQTRISTARFEAIAAAGGDPAYLGIRADASGSWAGLIASEITFSSVVGGVVVKALKLIDGEAYFGAPVSTTISGRRLTIGPGFGVSNGLVMWFGPSTTDTASMSRTNGYFALGTDGKVYYGSAELSGGGGFHAQASAASRIGTRTTAGSVTTATVTITTTGATGSVSYDWSQIGGEETWTITAPSGPETAFRVNVSSPGEIKRAQFACLVTDAGSGRAFTIPVGAAAIFNV